MERKSNAKILKEKNVEQNESNRNQKATIILLAVKSQQRHKEHIIKHGSIHDKTSCRNKEKGREWERERGNSISKRAIKVVAATLRMPLIV